MTRCVEFYDKFEKDGNFCHLSAAGVSQVKAYNELREKIAVHIPDKAFIVDNFPEGASRPLTSIKDDATRLKGLNYVIHCLERGEKVTAGDLKQTLNGWLKPKECAVEKLTNVKIPLEAPELNKNVKVGVQEEEKKPLGAILKPEDLRMDPVPVSAIITDTNIKVSPEYDNQPPVGRYPPPQSQPAFKTALEVKQGLTAPDREPKPEDPVKAAKEERRGYADQYIALLTKQYPRIQNDIADLMRDSSPSWKCYDDLLYFGIMALIEKKNKRGKT